MLTANFYYRNSGFVLLHPTGIRYLLTQKINFPWSNCFACSNERTPHDTISAGRNARGGKNFTTVSLSAAKNHLNYREFRAEKTVRLVSALPVHTFRFLPFLRSSCLNKKPHLKYCAAIRIRKKPVVQDRRNDLIAETTATLQHILAYD